MSTREPQAWSPNTWKVRLVLNYKRIPYKTVWVSYPDIEPKLKELGVNPTDPHPEDPSKPLYTLPVILDENGDEPVVIPDSLRIVEYLEEKYPERPVFPKIGKALIYGFEVPVRVYIGRNINPFINHSVWLILDKRGQEYFRTTREKWDGGKLEDESPKGPIRDGHWKALKEGFGKVAGILDKNGSEVDFVAGGSEPTFADFLIVAYLRWIKAILEDELEDNGFSQWDGGRWVKLLKRTEEWQEAQ